MAYDGQIDPQQGRTLLHALRAVAQAASGTDPYMVGHARRVADYCERMALAMGLPDSQRFLLALAAWFHDIGNLATPAYILRKPSELAEDEMEEMRVHPVRGAELFAGTPDLAEVARAIRHHHERVDGTGYPDGLRGDEIPLFSRLILVAETYEAMTHHRPYRRALPHAEAMRRIQDGAGSQFDPEVVKRFASLMGQNGDPPGEA